jgi:hypothetical protein
MPDHSNNTHRSLLEDLIRVDIVLLTISAAVLAVGFGLSTHAIRLGGAEQQTEPGSRLVSAIGMSESASEPPAADAPCPTFDERFHVDRPLATFDERFASAFGSSGNVPRKVATAEAPADDVPAQQPEKPEVVPAALTAATASSRASVREERRTIAVAPMSLRLPLDANSRTAIYDIAARTVYLPNGQKLEAHSGLGGLLDDPRFIKTKMQGPTPPNVYNLTLRERLFHGVRALRLTPVDDGKMFGRDGILAHSYMLGPNGQSNGCVSFRDYPAFLNAFLKGEVDRLVVVERLATTTGAKAGSASGG